MVLPCLMTAFNSIAGSCLGSIGERIKSEAAYIFDYGANVENLSTQVQNLTRAIQSMKDRIEEAENRRGETRVDAVVEGFLVKMASLRDEASKIITDEERSSDSKCLMGLRPNLWACYLISKSAKKVIDDATEQLEKEKNYDRPVAYVDYTQGLGVVPIAEFEIFESRVIITNQIVAALKDSSVNMVGMYGLGGAGKTTLAEKIGAELQLDRVFNFVVMATVSQKQDQFDNNYKPDLSNIQKQIAGGLKIQFRGETLRDRAGELREQLQKKDKVLIILDDIWSGFELKDVGIPIGNAAKKFKILMTSRSQDVLLKEMDSTSNFGLDSLPYPDAWILFDRMVGGHIKYYNWRPIAEQVVKQCGGIPIILVTIAKALRNEASESWEDALTQLKQFDSENNLESYKMIEVSYKFLNSNEKKKLLLLCAQLNHRSIPIEVLLKYAMGLNLFNGCKKLKDVRHRLHRSLNELKGCCLLQDGNEEGMIKMHDVIHKFASFVAFRDHRVFSVANDGELEEWPSKDELEHFSAISLPKCHLPPNQMLPAPFDNSKLESFLMLRSEIDASFQIPDDFFAGMKRLKLMHLTLMSLSPILVSSLKALVELRTLCLDGCKLGDISVIGELQMLQVLSLVGSSIILVPKEIGELGRTLKLLDLRDCRKLKGITSSVISRLTLLEDLRIGESFNKWQRLEGSNQKRSNIVDETNEAEMSSMEEFKNLQNLINVEIHILEHANMFPKDLVFKKLETFKIFFGNYDWRLRSNYKSTRTLEVDESTAVEFDGEGSKALLTSAESLLLAGVMSSITVSEMVLAGVMSSITVSEMDQKGFPKLKHLKVHSTKRIQYIVKKSYNTCIFPKLETLNLLYLETLERICDDHDHSLRIRSFENLRVIEVLSCDLLNHLLSSNLAGCILRLEEMRVMSCVGMESIIISKENEEEIKTGFTHQLRVLKLSYLPHLISFWSLRQLEGLPSPTPSLFNKKSMFPKLEELMLSSLEIYKIWDDHLVITAERTCSFHNLASLEVYACGNLSYVFTSSMVKSLAKLEILEVIGCNSIEEIVSTSKGKTEGEKLLLLPKLESLKLSVLPKLKRFCHANLLEFQSLQKLEISRCPLLSAFNNENESYLFGEKILFPKLEELNLTFMNIEKIWDDHLTISTQGTSWFHNLTSLKVFACHNLSYLFTSCMLKSIVKLKQLEVHSCGSIEEIVVSRAEDVQISFPNLDKIKLKALPKLKRFCKANLLECQLLRRLVIKKCLDLKTFISGNDSSSSDKYLFTEKVAFPNMEGLKMVDCPSLTSIFPASIVSTTLQEFDFNNTQQLNDAFTKLQSTVHVKYYNLDFERRKLNYQNQRVTLKIPLILFVLLKRFPRLKKLEVSSYSILQQFPSEPDHLVVAADDMDTHANLE